MGKILLVDDDDRLRDSFYNILGMEGHTVRTAASGETALRLAEEETPDAVIMDVRMPGMDGLTALRLLHGRDPRLPVIIMTAYSTTESAIEATKLGAFDYILKPFEIPDMLELVTKALEAGRLMRGRVVFSPEEETDAEAIIGDATHGKGPLNRWWAQRLGLQRLWLHAWQLEVPHPETGAPLRIDSGLRWPPVAEPLATPTLPPSAQDWQRLLCLPGWERRGG